jgi:hypothetical protein
MGSKILCKKATSGIPKAAVATWSNGDSHYYLVEATSANSPGKAADGLIHQAGFSSWKEKAILLLLLRQRSAHSNS